MNRHLVDLGFTEHDYYSVFVPFYLDPARLAALERRDIHNIVETHNKARCGEKVLGRHFFYKLGRRYQDVQVASVDRQKAPTVARLG